MDCANFLFYYRKGPIYGYFSERGLRSLLLPGTRRSGPYLLRSAANVVLGGKLSEALDRYFAGIQVNFRDIPLDLFGATAFRQRVWLAAREIPWGQTTHYAGLAERMGCVRGAARAVGQALGANPIPILIPCHRVLAADGSLGGFSAGLDWKRALLRIEGSTHAPRPRPGAKRNRLKPG
jgi:methylated-DNA-[protein]-cysteine S-methyltransferase